MCTDHVPQQSRRALLASVSLGLIAGCTSAEETPPGIGELSLSNRTESPVTASLSFDQGETSGQTDITIPPAGEGGYEGKTVVEPWMGDHGSWDLVVETDSMQREYSSEAFDQRFYDYDATDCLLIDIRIESDQIEITPRTVAVECP